MSEKMSGSIQCPECFRSVDYSSILIKPCYSCHVLCENCLNQQFRSRHEEKDKCWLLGKNCRPHLIHLNCRQCETTYNVFHIPNNNIQSLSRLEETASQTILDQRKANLRRIMHNTMQDLKTNCKESREKLKKLKDQLNEHTKNCRISKIVGSSVGLVGGGLFIAGAILAPFTFGASTPLMIAGGVVGGVGGGTAGGTSITELVINKGSVEETQKLLKDVQDLYVRLIDYANEYRILTALSHLAPGIVSGGVQMASNIGIGIFRLVQMVGESGGAAFRISAAALRISTTVLHAVGGVLAGIAAIVDIATIISNGKELYKGEEAKFAIQIQNIIDEIGQIEKMSVDELINGHVCQ